MLVTREQFTISPFGMAGGPHVKLAVCAVTSVTMGSGTPVGTSNMVVAMLELLAVLPKSLKAVMI